MADLSAVILAGGEGKRMKSSYPKVICRVLFKPMIDWVIDAVRNSGINEICVVTGYMHEQLENHLNGSVKTVLQKEQLGTGHAVMQADSFLRENIDKNVIILCGDVPLINESVIKSAVDFHIDNNNSATVITAIVDNPYGYGRILRDEYNEVCGIIEHKDANPKQKEIKEINSGTYIFKTADLLDALDNISNNNSQQEYYLTDALSVLLSKNKKISAYVSENPEIVLGANDRLQLQSLNEKARHIVLDRLIESGVEIISRDGIIISPDAVIGSNTTILPNTIIKGKSIIGHNCTLGPNSYIENSIISDNVVINNSQVNDSTVKSGTRIGPFCNIRPNSFINQNVKIGDFVEIKNSNIDDNTSIAHLTYIGDSDVGKNVNFGCGCVTVNYDGHKKSRTIVGDNAFIGCNTNLIAPVRVGKNAYTGAGSTITKDVPDNSLGIARVRQENKEGWVIRRNKKSDK